jgi:magnesium transporter
VIVEAAVAEQQPLVAARSCTVTAQELDFEAKIESTVSLASVRASMEAGRFVWIDLDTVDPEEARRILCGLALVDDDAIDAALRAEPATLYHRYDDYIHLVMSGCHRRGDDLDLERLSLFMGERFLITIHNGTVDFLTAVRRDYHADFVRFAKSPSFLIYELWDHLVDNYLAMQKLMSERVEQLQGSLHSGHVDDLVFARISDVGADLLHFRKILLPARAVLTDLSTRRSLVLNDVTQRFLGNMVGSIDHVLQDMLVDREILSESLNLYMSVVSHRTNQVMRKLTVVSVVFLPLTFLVGVYGMNFEILPELKWRFGYLYFWGLVAVIVGAIIQIIRRGRLL